MTCSEFIRKHGDAKKDPIIVQLKMYYTVILNWFSVDCLDDENVIVEMCRISIKLWPWTCTNYAMQLVFMKTVTFLSEDSVPVCKALATYHTGNSQSLLQLFGEFAMNETAKPKQPNSDFVLLELAMRILSNCCSCVEGRMQLGKVHFIIIIIL